MSTAVPHERHLPKTRSVATYLEAIFPSAFANSQEHVPVTLSTDPALTAFCQLGALKLNARSCVISLCTRDSEYIIGESSQSHSLQTHGAHAANDGLLLGVSALPLSHSMTSRAISRYNQAAKRAEAGVDGEPPAPVFAVTDLSADEHLRDISSATGFASLVGVPLVLNTSGRALGSIYVLDVQPRAWLTDSEIGVLHDLATAVMTYLERARMALLNDRKEKMIRGIGAFVEKEDSIRAWWDRNSFHPRHRSIPAERSTADYFVDSSGIGSRSHAGPSGGQLQLPSVKPVLETIPESKRSLPQMHPPPNTERERMTVQRERSFGTAQIHSVIARAANIIREAVELDGVLFLDARVPSSRPGVSLSPAGASQLEVHSASSSGSSSHGYHDPERPCQILGMSSNVDSFPCETSPATNLSLFPESVLRYLLRKYPKGRIFSLEELSSASDAEKSNSSMSDDLQPLTDSARHLKLLGRKKKISRANEVAIMSAAFTGAKSVMFFPLLKPENQQWLSAAFAYTCSPLREFSVEDDLSYLIAFGNSVVAEVAKADALQDSDAKTTFIGAISHELRSPLHGIIASADMLRESHLSNSQFNMLQNIQICGSTLLDTIEHLLDFSKTNHETISEQISSSSHKQLKLKHASDDADARIRDVNLDLGVVVEEIMQMTFEGPDAALTDEQTDIGRFHPSATLTLVEAASKELWMVLEINRPDRCHYSAQPGAIKRIISNLVSNALKYTTSGFVHVKIAQSLIPADDYLASDAECEAVQIVIKDSGLGMSKEFLRDRLFKPFSQENPHATGTGLGLSIVKQIVSSLHGTIKVHSEIGVGTKISVVLPLSAPHSARQSTTISSDNEIRAANAAFQRHKVALVGFNACDASDVRSPHHVTTGQAMLGSSLASFCRQSLEMQVEEVSTVAEAAVESNVIIASLATVKLWSNSAADAPAPLLVICPSSRVAAFHTRQTRSNAPEGRVHYIAQPVGSVKLAKALKSLLLTEEPNIAMPISTRTRNTIHPPPTVHNGETPVASNESIDMRNNHSTAPGGQLGTPAHKLESLGLHYYILLVDDNLVNLKLLQAFCKKLGVGFATASNGQEAFDVYKASCKNAKYFSHVLMDINMPVMDGLAATRAIRQFERTDMGSGAEESPLAAPRSTIIALTGLSGAAAEREASSSGVDVFLTKPIRFLELKDILAAL